MTIENYVMLTAALIGAVAALVVSFANFFLNLKTKKSEAKYNFALGQFDALKALLKKLESDYSTYMGAKVDDDEFRRAMKCIEGDPVSVGLPVVHAFASTYTKVFSPCYQNNKDLFPPESRKRLDEQETVISSLQKESSKMLSDIASIEDGSKTDRALNILNELNQEGQPRGLSHFAKITVEMDKFMTMLIEESKKEIMLKSDFLRL